MVLWEITLATAYFLGLRRTYRLALKIQRKVISRKCPRLRQFAQRYPFFFFFFFFLPISLLIIFLVAGDLFHCFYLCILDWLIFFFGSGKRLKYDSDKFNFLFTTICFSKWIVRFEKWCKAVFLSWEIGPF